MTSSVSDEGFHLRYVFEDADIVLLSCDNVKFRVHSILMKTCSTIFRDMIELARPSDEVPLSEDSKSLALLLDFIYPNDAPALPHPDTLRDVKLLANIADKFEIPRVLAGLRSVVLGDKKYRKDPVALYALACKWQWDDVADVASTETLKYNVVNKFSIEELSLLKGDDVCRLLKLHGMRKSDILMRLANYKTAEYYKRNIEPEDDGIYPSAPVYMSNCGCTQVLWGDGEEAKNPFYRAYLVLNNYITGSLTDRPLGDQLLPNAFSHPMFDFARNMVCPSCKGKIFDLDQISAEIGEQVERYAVRSIRDVQAREESRSRSYAEEDD